MTNKLMTMRQHPGLLLAGLLSVAFCSTYARAQEISVIGGRPVDKAIEKLESAYRVPITYEDTLYLNDNDFVDVTAEVRRDHDGSNPNRVLVPARRTITFTLAEAEIGKIKSQADRTAAALTALKSVIDSYALAGGAGGFSVSEDSSGLHVVSRAFKDASGQSQTLWPALDIPVWSTQRSQPALDVIEEICQRVSLGGRIVVEVGTVPINLLANQAVNVDVKNVAARDVLESISKQIGTPLSWELFCDPRDGGCALNMHVVQ